MSVEPLQKLAQYLPGVGPQRAELLRKLGIETVEDLLWHLPRELLDLSTVVQPDELTGKTEQTVRGRVVDIDSRRTRTGKTIVAAVLDCGTGYVRGVWFNQPWMLRRLTDGDWMLWSGKPKRSSGRWEFSHPRLQWIEAADIDAHGGLLPKYPLTEGLMMEDMRRMVRSAVETAADEVPDPLPGEFLQQQNLPPLAEALRGVHVPTTTDEYETGRRRLLFDDLLEFQTGVALRRRAWRTGTPAPSISVSAKVDARIRRLFPFRLTPGQEAAIRDITADLAAPVAMHRLVQADVGAGKTIIAAYALLATIAKGLQGVLMAPTELLAVQHWETMQSMLAHSRVHRALLTGSLTTAQRNRVRDEIASGETQLIVGTQAVIQEGVRFNRLGLVVIDEQHKFGVRQRATFSKGDESPHVLVMTATPIPRSLCLTQFGDLDLTVIKDLPPGRQPIITGRVTGEAARRRAWDFVRGQLDAGRQAYIVCPRIGADDESGGAVEAYHSLSRGELHGRALGLIHGGMPRDERARLMQQFRDRELEVLVSTTVIEVGVDVPNATLMVVLEADRFGLSQLHQLRGRIGRGKFQGYCLLFSESDSPEALARLEALEQSSNGFEIAEKDFELRGPGDVLGTRQHGALPLRVADLRRDAELLESVRNTAFELVESGRIDTPPFAPLKIRVMERFGKLFELPQSG